MNILNFSSHFEDCGIAKYQEHYIKGIEKNKEFKSTFFEYSPYQTRNMNHAQFEEVLQKLRLELPKFQILHIQHEFGFYRHGQFEQIIKTAKEIGIRVVVTYHTSPDLIIIKKRLTGFGPRSIVSFLKSYRHNAILSKMHTAPLNNTDAIIVHNKYTAEQLKNYGVSSHLIHVLPHPTYNITTPPKTTFIRDSLHKQKGDVILSTVGYIHRFKGVDKAIKALSYLPENYKLAVLGGVKSDSDDKKLYDQLADLIIKRGLKDRVFISGVIPSDEDLDSYIRETDISLYPYDSQYYKGVASGALNLAIANERPIVAYPVSTFIETNDKFGQIMFTDSDSYYELAREINRLDIESQTEKITSYAKANSFDNMAKSLVDIYSSL